MAREALARAATAAEWWLQRWGDRSGQDAAHSREWAEYLAACTRDVLRADDQGSFDDDGSWEDNSAFYLPWRFDLADIRAPVGLWHGLKDFIPVAHARWLADRIPHVTTHFPADEDHTNIEENNRTVAYAWLREHCGPRERGSAAPRGCAANPAPRAAPPG